MVQPPAKLFYGRRNWDSDLFRVNYEGKHDTWKYTARNYFCPGCGMHFRLAAFDEEREKFHFPIDEWGNIHQWGSLYENHGFENEENIEIYDENDVYRHIDQCHEPIPDGIHHVHSKSDSRLLKFVQFFSRLSSADTNMGSSAGQTAGIFRGECEAYLLVDEGIPVSYVGTTSRYVIESQKNATFLLFEGQPDGYVNLESKYPDLDLILHGEVWMISDLFTMYDYRRNGHSRRIIQHVINEKGMNIGELPVTIPLTEASMNLFKELSTGSILGLRPEGNGSIRVNRDDLSKLVKTKSD